MGRKICADGVKFRHDDPTTWLSSVNAMGDAGSCCAYLTVLRQARGGEPSGGLPHGSTMASNRARIIAMVQKLPFSIDPDDPRAPTEEQWAALSEEQRRLTLSMLPADVPFELFMPEGDAHRLAKQRAIGSLDAFFRKLGRKVYLSSELGVYYPGEPRFAPDVLAVLDIEPHPREKWVVSQEGKGLDLVLEVHVSGQWKKDFEGNRRRYARLGIPEYFLFDRTRDRLFGWRLPGADARAYEAIVPQLGRYSSSVLGLELGIEGDRLRFSFGTVPLPEADELVGKLECMVDDLVQRREEEREARERAEQERNHEREARARAEQERDAALRRLAELEAELAKQPGSR